MDAEYDLDDTVEKCQRCGKNHGVRPHPCPYKCDINDDDRTLCNCCASCKSDCADEV